MFNPYLVLILIAFVILIGYLGEVLFRITKIPEILILLFVGLLIGPITNIIPSNYITYFRDIAPIFSDIAIVVIIFEGGRKIEISGFLKNSAIGTILAILDIAIPAVIFSYIMYYMFSWPYIYGAILGSIIGETTLIVVLPVISRIKISQDLYGTIVTEATLNSVFAIFAFSILIQVFNSGSFDIYQFSKFALDSISIAVVLGVLVGFAWLIFLAFLKGIKSYVATIGVAFLLYGIVDYFGGSAVIAIFVFALVVGNYKTINRHFNLKIDIRENEMDLVEDSLTFLVRSFFFVFMGLIAIINFDYFLYALIITIILIAIRYLEVFAIIRKKEYRPFVTSLLPRGLTSALLSTILLTYNNTYFNEMFYIIFMIIILTNIISAGSISKTARAFENKQS